MSTLLVARSKRAALAASFLIPFAGAAFAQSADGRSTADIEKENAALRAKVHRLEAEKENIGLRAKVDQLSGRRPVQAVAAQRVEAVPQPLIRQDVGVAPQPLITRIETSTADRTLVMADLPMKTAPAPVPAAYYSWSGFYLGGNIGYGLAIDRVQSSFVTLGGAAIQMSAADTAVTPAGAIGGIQLGYNWQGGPNWLVGFEADVQGSAQKATSCILSCSVSTGFLETRTDTQSLDYFGTLRGRFGYVDRGNLFYVTGGGAYAHVNHTLEFNALAPNDPTFVPVRGTSITSENKFGWVVGAGLESSLGGNWTGKVEYLYMGLGSSTATLNGSFGGGLPFTLTATTTLHDNIVRAGLNYRFGPPAGPVSAYDAMAAVPPPIYSWSGFYIGANVGYGFGNDHNQIDVTNPFGPINTSEPGTSVTPKGGLGGLQFGYNWQSSPRWLVGFEADLQGTAQNDTACSAQGCYNWATPNGPEINIITVQHQLDYFGTVRGRLGYLFNNTLFYGTGGAAFGQVRETAHMSFDSFMGDMATTKQLAGYALGGGIETMVGSGWSAKAEYLYMNLGNISSTGNIPGGSVEISNSTVRDHIVRAGLNYHIGAAPY